jgi:FkbM family methyltransferase
MKTSSKTRDLIFDVGLNVGQDTAFYLSRGYRVVAIEADPILAEAARKRFCHDIEAGNLEIVNAGIAAHEGITEFWICDGKSEFNSFHKDIAARDGYPHHRIEVPTVRFASVLERFGTPYFLKIDIEGNDVLCLGDLSPSSLPRFISVESECTTGDGATSVEDGLLVLRTLRDLGYRRFQADRPAHILIARDSFGELPPRFLRPAYAGQATVEQAVGHISAVTAPDGQAQAGAQVPARVSRGELGCGR